MVGWRDGRGLRVEGVQGDVMEATVRSLLILLKTAVSAVIPVCLLCPCCCLSVCLLFLFSLFGIVAPRKSVIYAYSESSVHA